MSEANGIPAAAPSVVLMGVSGCGKSSVGKRVAEQLDWPFLEGDSLHSPHNVAKMRRGEPLTDADREPWLHAIAAWIAACASDRRSGVVTCSSLKRRYRDTLRTQQPQLRFAWLHADRDTLLERLEQRQGHFMSAQLLDSQLQTLEPPQDDEAVIRLDAAADIQTLAAAVARYATTR